MQGEPVQGLRSLEDGFIPPIIDLSLLDRKIFVTNADAITFTRKLLDEERVFAGVSSGAIARVAVRIAGRARRGQRRLHRRRRRLEVPLIRDLHTAAGRDREPGLHRLVVRGARRCDAPPRQSWPCSWWFSAHVCCPPAGDRRRRRYRPRRARRPPPPCVDAGTLNGVLAQYQRTIAGYTAAGPLLSGSDEHADGWFLGQQLSHAGDLRAFVACIRRRRRTTPTPVTNSVIRAPRGRSWGCSQRWSGPRSQPGRVRSPSSIEDGSALVLRR